MVSGLSSPAKSESGESMSEAVLCPGGAVWGCEPLGDVDTGLWIATTPDKCLSRSQGIYSLTLPMSHVRLTPEK